MPRLLCRFSCNTKPLQKDKAFFISLFGNHSFLTTQLRHNCAGCGCRLHELSPANASPTTALVMCMYELHALVCVPLSQRSHRHFSCYAICSSSRPLKSSSFCISLVLEKCENRLQRFAITGNQRQGKSKKPRNRYKLTRVVTDTHTHTQDNC